ncbi:putative glutathione-specific gamma-glutamylcyclotransferase 2 isoform X1 [Strongylocentrotus purpuratus]|uniref:glutathione-specific gamma-glutamylcyclotransferase n=1 Tax=Strongylocentrotus purpuratus TaxID=7668 RepID=A0A7M7TGA4_STRPU|nr:putative glutathione-specific gamma-glutamylcyclotransferase 2 isoform X1 [Strongylocentrotus purpuratus]
MWIFGYGSLTWKTDFPYTKWFVGSVDGYARRFWQASMDHRGVPDKPGRVVTLIETPGEQVWGIAYHVAESDRASVKEYLDFREKNGYTTKAIMFYPLQSEKNSVQEPFEVLVYIATPCNPAFLGPAPLEEIANQIVSSEGPSGKNKDYLLQLASTMRKLVPDCNDTHLFELETLVKRLMSEDHHQTELPQNKINEMTA